MELIAEALQTALPELLEMTDLDRQTLDALTGGHAIHSLPEGFVRFAILTEFQAFSVKQWDDQNRKKLAKRRVR